MRAPTVLRRAAEVLDGAKLAKGAFAVDVEGRSVKASKINTTKCVAYCAHGAIIKARENVCTLKELPHGLLDFNDDDSTTKEEVVLALLLLSEFVR